MASIQFVSPIIKAAIVSLRTWLPGQIAAFNLEPANAGAQLGVPADPGLVTPLGSSGLAYYFGAAGALGADGFPAIEVGSVRGDFGAWAAGKTDVNHDPYINVVAWLEADTGEVAELHEKILGLGRCIVEVLTIPDAFGPQVEISSTNGLGWRVDQIPDPPTAKSREDVERWRSPWFGAFHLETVEKFV